MSDLQATIEEAFERRADITPRSVETHVKEGVMTSSPGPMFNALSTRCIPAVAEDNATLPGAPT